MKQPRNVRNFWIVADIDGRTSKLAGGPSGKLGGFDLTVYMRADGEAREAVSLLGRASADGDLRIKVQPNDKRSITFDETTGELVIRSQR